MSETCCKENMGFSRHGAAIHTVYIKENGEIWVENGEYKSRVRYCPYCGREQEVDS